MNCITNSRVPGFSELLHTKFLPTVVVPSSSPSICLKDNGSLNGRLEFARVGSPTALNRKGSTRGFTCIVFFSLYGRMYHVKHLIAE